MEISQKVVAFSEYMNFIPGGSSDCDILQCPVFSTKTHTNSISFFIFTAVKFGRMSKKQREKVEDEVRYHKEMNSQQAQRDAASGLNLNGGSGSIGSASTTGSGNGNHGSGSSPDSSVFDPPQPSSTEHMYGGGGFPYDSGKDIFLN